MKKYLGIYSILTTVLITLVLWLGSKSGIYTLFDNPLRSLSQIIALQASVLLAWEFLLATRVRFLEKIFGGLENVYKSHHIVGGLSYSLILLHPLLLIINAIPNTKLALLYVLPSSSISYTMGVLALYLFSLLLIITFYIKIPYKIWKQTHHFMGIPLLITLAHVLLITSDTSNFLPLKIWIISLLIVAVFSFIYKRFLYTKFSRKYEYEIVEVKLLNGIIEVIMSPLKNQIKTDPGQYVFTRFHNKYLGSELHPFSISSGSNDSQIRLSIKTDGDYTRKLDKLEVGERVTLYGPHGNFFEKYLVKRSDSVMIAGGIGVTPFLSLINSNPLNEGNISMYYSCRDDSDAVYHEEINEISKLSKNMTYKKIISSQDGKITAEMINNEVPELENKYLFLCGPNSMMNDLTNQFIQLGIKRSKIIYEEFDFVS
jgi:predicted ferric reductase